MKTRTFIAGVVVALLGATLLACTGLECRTRTDDLSAERRTSRMNQSPNHDGKTFVNLLKTSLTPSAGEFWNMTSRYLFGKVPNT